MKLYDFAKKNNIELKPRNVPMGSIESAQKKKDGGKKIGKPAGALR